MKKLLPVALLLLVCTSALLAQTNSYKILFDITSKDTADHQTVIRHISGMSKAYPDANLEVVIYGGAWPMVVKEKSAVAESVLSLCLNKNVHFKLCEETMKRQRIDKSMLIQGVQTVPDAIIELVTKQGQGWGYIKEAHK